MTENDRNRIQRTLKCLLVHVSGVLLLLASSFLPGTQYATILADYFHLLLYYCRFCAQIFVAMVCVFGTGWPFVGVMFLPMLLNCAWVRLTQGTSFAEGLGAATAAAIWALVCAAAVAGLATWTDSAWYGRTTSPTFNIMQVLVDTFKGCVLQLWMAFRLHS